MERSIEQKAPNGKETRIEKARRLVREGKVREVRPGVYEVTGDTAPCIVDLNLDAGSCRANAFDAQRPCSHRLAAEVFAAFSRKAAA